MKPLGDKHLAILRRHMVDVIGIHADLSGDELGTTALDGRVLDAMLEVPRHRFVPAPLVPVAYQDTPLPIGFDKTISQPFIVALMTHLLDPRPDDRVLEVGTGFGYQTAILSRLAGHVWTVEVVEEFATGAEERLQALGTTNVTIRTGDGSRGWPEHQPFDKILVAAAAERPPRALLDQLRPGGRLVMPLGPSHGQEITVVEKDEAGRLRERASIAARFGELETVI